MTYHIKAKSNSQCEQMKAIGKRKYECLVELFVACYSSSQGKFSSMYISAALIPSSGTTCLYVTYVMSTYSKLLHLFSCYQLIYMSKAEKRSMWKKSNGFKFMKVYHLFRELLHWWNYAEFNQDNR